jgi:hypothetical protein
LSGDAGVGKITTKPNEDVMSAEAIIISTAAFDGNDDDYYGGDV